MLNKEIILKNYEDLVSTIFYEKNGEVFYNFNNEPVCNLCLLVDFKPFFEGNNPIILKYGEEENIKEVLSYYDNVKDFFDLRIIHLPTNKYKWVDYLFSYSANNHILVLLNELGKETIVKIFN